MQIPEASAGTLDIVINAGGGRVEGTVAATDPESLVRVQVVLVPDQRNRYDLFRAATLGRDGRFTIRGVTPGGYTAFAFSGLDAYGYFDSALLARAGRTGTGVKFRVSEASVSKIEVSIAKF